MTLEVIAEDPRWEAAGLERIAARVWDATLSHRGLDSAGFEAALLACDDTRIAALNADFRGKPRPTNVLSWPSEERAPDRDGAVPAPPAPGAADDPLHLGDIALAFDTCVAEARAAGLPLEDHASHLIAHGILHLLGFDHNRDGDAALMEQFEREILGNLGLSDPY